MNTNFRSNRHSVSGTLPYYHNKTEEDEQISDKRADNPNIHSTTKLTFQQNQQKYYYNRSVMYQSQTPQSSRNKLADILKMGSDKKISYSIQKKQEVSQDQITKYESHNFKKPKNITETKEQEKKNPQKKIPNKNIIGQKKENPSIANLISSDKKSIQNTTAQQKKKQKVQSTRRMKTIQEESIISIVSVNQQKSPQKENQQYSIKKFKQLQQQNQMLKQKIKKTENDYESKMEWDRVNQKQWIKENYSKIVMELQNKNKSLQQQLKQHKDRIITLKKKISQPDSEQKNILQKTISSQQTKIQQLTAQFQELQRQSKPNQKLIKQIQSLKRQASSQIQQLTRKNNSLETENIQLLTQKQKIEKQLQKLKKKSLDEMLSDCLRRYQ